MSNLFPDDEVREKALHMLEHDLIAWIVTVGADGAPHAVPVWFFWHDGRVYVFSEPSTAKVRHVRAGSPVVIHLQAGGRFGDDVVVLRGSAEIAEQSAASVLAPFRSAYADKYREAIADYGMPLEQIEATFSAAIMFTPVSALAW
ncbi:pyridoxamine 5'-phosphate oxidase family protein [Herbiconiux moechotypicola]|uniref:Pyridoxamine 5'-phosphate oxidase N-terminal domain-containing protein n=1 Tax=Herbiconiux moechotypicola TaxID=637393 RepID=A0ABP5QWL1_9MICO|nr:pyridoxamine 5'-phosphate oxidase family protein [Herbiconiux moechotypicola]MCS5731084.1 pyridoxamine 5'-phosphate oxidase family protein [Herbiconiux moechotypicola]